MLAITSYGVFVALHVIAVVGAYGLPLAYPLMLPYLRRAHPRSMPGVHDVQHRLNKILTGPGTLLVLGAGIYLASKADAWDEPWVGVGFTAIIIIALAGGWIVGTTAKLAEMAQADVAAAGPGGDVAWSPEYEALYHRYERVELFLGLVVMVTIFCMAAKPGS
ncbi:MAG: hypothetical protein ACJ762_00380 [Solirubrobacteraceae bacterium]